jgi:hypothetical protein
LQWLSSSPPYLGSWSPLVAARLAFAGVALLYGVRLAFKGGTASAVPGARRPTPSSIGALVSGLAVAPPPLAGCLAVVPCPGSSPAVVPGSSRPPVDVPDAFRPTLVGTRSRIVPPLRRRYGRPAVPICVVAAVVGNALVDPLALERE